MSSIFTVFNKIVDTTIKAVTKAKNSFLSYLLIKASKYNFDGAITPLIKLGANIEATDKAQNTALHYAVMNQNEKTIPVLIKNGASIDDIENINKKTAWSLAIDTAKETKAENIEVLRLLLKIKSHDPKEILAKALLFRAETRGEFHHLQEFIDLGADILRADKNGNTLLHFAALVDKKIAMITLIKNKANPMQQNKKGATPWHFAARAHSNEAITVLWACSVIKTFLDHQIMKIPLTHKKDINVIDFAGNTPLHEAVATIPLDDNGKKNLKRVKETIALLIKYGANITVLNKEGMSLLHAAALSKESTALEYLLALKTLDVNAKGLLDLTPLHSALYAGANRKIVEVLINNGASTTAKDTYGNIPLHYFLHIPQKKYPIESNPKKLAEYYKFLNLFFPKNISHELRSAQLFAANNLGQTPLHKIIAENPDVRIIKQLLSHGDPKKLEQLVNTRDNARNTLLHAACEYNNNSILYKPKTQLEYKDIFDELDENALEIIKLLIDKGANLNVTNNDHDTPLAVAQKYGSKIIADYLIAKDATKTLVDKGLIKTINPIIIPGYDDHKTKHRFNIFKKRRKVQPSKKHIQFNSKPNI